jgi:glycine/D-amino acid oxidase-like deaminating enzyme
MTAAPVTGKIVTDLVAGRRPMIDILPFAPARFG